MVRWTHGEVRNWSAHPRGGLGWVWGPLVKSMMFRWTIWEVQNGSGNLGEVRDGSGDNRGCPRRVGGTSERSGTVG